MRVTAFITDTAPGIVAGQLVGLELRHRQHARVEDRIRQAKAAGLANLPCHGFDANAAWLEIVLAAADLVAWTQLIAFSSSPELARCEIHAFRYRVLRRSPHHPRRPSTPATHRRHLALGRRNRDRLAPPARRLPLNSHNTPVPTTRKTTAAPGTPASPGDTGGSNLPQAQNNGSSATFRPQHHRTPPAFRNPS